METKIINLTIKADDDPQEVKENLKKILAGVDSDLDPEDIDEIVAGVTEKINARRSLMEKAHEAWKEHKDAIIPVSRWKEYGYDSPQAAALDWNNLQAAHYCCNAAKSNRVNFRIGAGSALLYEDIPSDGDW